MAKLHPVDELALIEAQIASLMARRTDLTCAIKRGEMSLSGRQSRAEVELRSRQVLRLSALPAQILADPTYWETEFDDVVVLHPTEQVSAAHQAGNIARQTSGLTQESAA